MVNLGLAVQPVALAVFVLEYGFNANGTTEAADSLDIRETEKSFHDFLRAADHRQQGGRSVGKEWFLTSLRFLDQIAKDKGLVVLFRVEDGALEE